MPDKAGDVEGGTAQDNGFFMELFYSYQAGLSCRYLRERLGSFKTILIYALYTVESLCSGVWQKIFKALSKESDNAYAMIDSTDLPAALGAKKTWKSGDETIGGRISYENSYHV